MANRSIIAIFIIVFVGISLIITIPILTLSNKLSSYRTIDWSHPYFFEPSSPSPIEKLYINADVGDVKIQYTTQPVNEHVKIDVNIEMSGANLAGKNYTDFFNIIWETTNSSAHLTLELLSESWFDDALWVEKNVVIQVTTREDIVFDIITNLYRGNFEITVPWAVSVRDLITNISNGIISYNFGYCTIEGNIIGNVDMGDIFHTFDHCTLQGNITGIANDGDIELMTYNPEYTRNTIWTYKSNAGDITIDISHINQYNIMNANITGSLVGNEFGDIIVYYYDNTANIGAMITLNDTRQNLELGRSSWVGFNKSESFEGIPYVQFTSTDFPTTNNYNLLLEGLTLNKGMYEVLLSSS